MNAALVIAHQIIIQQQIVIAATSTKPMSQLRYALGQHINTEEFGPIVIIDVLESVHGTGNVAYRVRQINSDDEYTTEDITPITS